MHGAHPVGLGHGPPLRIRDGHNWDGTERVEDGLMFGQVQASVQSGHERRCLPREQRKRIVIEVKVKEVELGRAPIDALQHHHVPRALRLDGAVRDPNALHMMMLERVYRRASEFDFLHFHLDYYPFSLFSRQATPFVTTLHGRLDLPEHQPVFDTFRSVPVVSISNAQRRPLPQAHWVRTVPHGLPTLLLQPRPVKPSYFAFLGRIAPEKGIDRAIRIAKHCGVPLKIAAKVDKVDREYFDEQIKPMIEPPIEYIGEIGDADKSEFLSGAFALLVPIDWPEPFGLVMIEAMACGTPVIAYNRGSVPEIVDEGLTGFVVEDEAGAIGAVDRLSE